MSDFADLAIIESLTPEIFLSFSLIVTEIFIMTNKFRWQNFRPQAYVDIS